MKIRLEPIGDVPPIPLDKRIVFFGRKESCDVRFGKKNVSRRHGFFAKLNGGVIVVRDLNSNNGTFINYCRITKQEILMPGDTVKITLKDYEYKVVEEALDQAKVESPQPPPLEPAESIPEPQAASPEANVQKARLMLVSLDTKSPNHEITKEVTVVGKHETCDIQLTDPGVSSFHLAFLRTGENTLLLRDLASTNHTKLNDFIVEKGADISIGDNLDIGGVKFQFQLVPEEAASSQPTQSPDEARPELNRPTAVAPEGAALSLQELLGANQADQAAPHNRPTDPGAVASPELDAPVANAADNPLVVRDRKAPSEASGEQEPPGYRIIRAADKPEPKAENQGGGPAPDQPAEDSSNPVVKIYHADGRVEAPGKKKVAAVTSSRQKAPRFPRLSKVPLIGWLFQD